METLGIYIQVPFCASKCSFCNFSSRVAPDAVLEPYCRALEQEIDLLPSRAGKWGIEQKIWTFPADSVYFGGGTPTLLGASRLARVFSALRRQFQIAADAEITVEVTPSSAADEMLDALHEMGVNRLSVGAQSFDDRELRSVGRLHSQTETVEQLHQAREAGFQNISLDLIAGLPYQTKESWARSLDTAVNLEPEHVSAYLLEVDEKSRLGKEVLLHGIRYHAEAVPDDEFMAWAYESAWARLAEAGYSQYEISNFARPGFESRHNLKYWQLKPYVGLGAGAHSFDGRNRWSNEVSPEAYQDDLSGERLPISDLRRLSIEEKIEEFFFLGLRQRAGVDLDVAAQRWGAASIAYWTNKVTELVRDGWLEQRGSRVWLAPRAYLISNEVFEEFLIDRPEDSTKREEARHGFAHHRSA